MNDQEKVNRQRRRWRAIALVPFVIGFYLVWTYLFAAPGTSRGSLPIIGWGLMAAGFVIAVVSEVMLNRAIRRGRDDR